MKFLIILLFTVFVFSSNSLAQVSITQDNHDSSKKIDITSNTLKIMPKERKAIFKENVVATQDDTVLTSDKMTVFYHDDEGKKRTGNRLSIIDTEGDVKLTMPDKKALAEHGKFDVDRGIIIMTKNVRLLQGEGKLAGGEKLIYDTVMKRSYIYGKSSGLPEESDEARIEQALTIRKKSLTKNPKTRKPKEEQENTE